MCLLTKVMSVMIIQFWTTTIYIYIYIYIYASCTVGTGSLPGVKRPGRGADLLPPPSAEVENE
jgi:hypothetical protein